MKILPIRFICGTCFKVERLALFVGDVSVTLPRCCGQEMLIAGEPKLDIHGLRKKGAWVDPVDNITPSALKPVWETMEEILEISKKLLKEK